MNYRIRLFKILLVIILFSICQISFGQSNNFRAFYLPNINTWLGNTVEENIRLSYAANNGFNYIIFYDLHLLDYNNNVQTNNLASFLSRARNNYGIIQVGACAETYSFFENKIIPYNNSRIAISEKFNVLNYEFEFWVQSTINQYYCNAYLQPNGYNCDTAGAWAFSFKQFMKIDSLCTTNGLISEVYLGWPTMGQMKNLANVADRILLHAYQSSDAGLYSYSRNRLIDAASINKAVNILPIFSSEPSFMGTWLQNHPIYQPYQTYSNNFISETGTWKQFINLQGYTWFYYPTMPQTASGTASITATGPTTLCLGDSIELTASLGASYLWSPGGETTQSITAKQTGNYVVNVLGPNGASVTSSPFTVTVGANQSPLLVNASGPVSFCTGDSVTLTCSSVGPYQWSNGATESSITVKDQGNYFVNVQTGNCVAASIPVNVTVSDKPETPVITCEESTIICPGSELTLNTAVSGNLLWSTGDTIDSIVLDTAGLYWVKVFSGPGCYSQSELTAVSYLSSPPIPIVSISGSNTFCDGDSITLTSTPADEYQWSNGATTPAITITETGTYSVIVYQGSCSNVSAPNNITFNPLPPKPFITTSGSTNLCSGQSVTLTSSSLNSNVWSNGATTVSIVVAQAGNFTVNIGSGSCSATSDPMNVAVISLPSRPVITANGSLSICPGTAVTLTSSALSQNLWSNGATTRSIVVSAGGSFSVKATQNGCTSSQSTTSSVTLKSAPSKPTITVTSGSTTLQNSSSSVTLRSSSASSYLWTNNATTRSLTVRTPGIYRVTVFNSNGCSNTSNDLKVRTSLCNPPATPVVTLSGSNILQPSGSVVLTSTTASGYLWSTGATTRTITVSTAGTYSVRVFSTGTCYSTSLPIKIYVIASRFASLDNKVQEDELKAYPNPAHEMITFSFFSDVEKKCILKLVDLNGREVEMHTFNLIIGMNSIELNLSNYKKGFYIACLMTDDKLRFLKINRLKFPLLN